MKRSSRRRFAYQLAVKLGHVNVDAMLRLITAKQFVEWEAYARLEPFNELQDNYRTAAICQMIFNMAVAAKDRKKDLSDFLLKVTDEEASKPKKQTWQEQLAIARMWALAFADPKA